MRRSYDILKDGVLISTNSDRHDSSPWGQAGGHDAGRTKFTLYRGHQAVRVPGASNIECRDTVREDVRCGRVSERVAVEIYGLTGPS